MRSEAISVDHGEPMGITPGDVDLHQQVPGNPQYKGILQYKYICGICHGRGHYDHQCHTLQHLFHAMQQQTGQQMAQPTTEYDNTNQTDQSAF